TVALSSAVAVDRQTSALNMLPPLTISGTVVNDAGSGISGATVSWDADPSLTAVSGGGGGWSLSGAIRDLDLTVRAAASGFAPAFPFGRSLREPADPASILVRMTTPSAVASLASGLGEIQAPSLGMILGRVLDSGGAPLSGATVSVDPAVGSVHY